MLEIEDIDHLAKFLMDIDALKLTERTSHIADGSRRENSAEHSWHVVIAAWTLANHARVPVCIERLLKLAALHDLCELDYGDTCIHTGNAEAKQGLEARCVARLMTEYGGIFGELEDLWKEYEARATTEAKFVYAADRMLPFMHNLANEGRVWRQHKISRSQVLRIFGPLEEDFPELGSWVREKIEGAVEAGWLRSD